MNLIERQEAYRAVKERYDLRARQRDALDASPKLDAILEWAHSGHWHQVNVLIESEGVLDVEEGPKIINIYGANYGAIQM